MLPQSNTTKRMISCSQPQTSYASTETLKPQTSNHKLRTIISQKHPIKKEMLPPESPLHLKYHLANTLAPEMKPSYKAIMKTHVNICS